MVKGSSVILQGLELERRHDESNEWMSINRTIWNERNVFIANNIQTRKGTLLSLFSEREDERDFKIFAWTLLGCCSHLCVDWPQHQHISFHLGNTVLITHIFQMLSAPLPPYVPRKGRPPPPPQQWHDVLTPKSQPPSPSPPITAARPILIFFPKFWRSC